VGPLPGHRNPVRCPRDKAAREHSEKQAEAARRFEQTQAALLAQDEQRNEQHARLLEQNTALTREVARLTQDLHAALIQSPKGSADA
jgi:type II secretory pathway component HofQ